MSDGFVIVGRIRKPHGIRGEVIVEPLCDAPGDVFAPGRRVFAGDTEGALPSETPPALHVTRGRPFKDSWLVSLTGIEDRNTSELWRNRYLLAAADDLPPVRDDEYLVHELIGMHVLSVDGSAIGEVRELETVPQGYLLQVNRNGTDVAIPFVDAIVVGIDREARTVTIDPPEGLLEL